MLDVITKARSEVIITSPFFASLILKMPLIKTTAIKTMGTDGTKVYFNEEWVKRLSREEVKGVIIHEILHCTFLHFARRENRHKKRWNIACDYAENYIITDSGFSLPKNALRRIDLDGMSAEAIYAKLEKEEAANKESVENGDEGNVPSFGEKGGGFGESTASEEDVDDWNFGEVIDSPEDVDAGKLSKEWEILGQKALLAGKKAGNVHADIARELNSIANPKLSWKEILSRFLTENSREDYNWTVPNRRYLSSNIYLPALDSPTIGQICILVDTSGSIQQKDLDDFAAEIQGVLSSYPGTQIKVIYVDTKVAGVEDVEIEDLSLHPAGGGGTDFKPGFEYIEKEGVDPICVIYFTDGYCYSYPPEPDYPTLWAVIDNDEFKPPFGEVIEMEANS